MDRCHLKGEMGDRLHAVLCAAGYNVRWLLRMIAKKGMAFLPRLFLHLLRLRYAGCVQGLQARIGAIRRWLVTVSASQTSVPALRLAANAAF